MPRRNAAAIAAAKKKVGKAKIVETKIGPISLKMPRAVDVTALTEKFHEDGGKESLAAGERYVVQLLALMIGCSEDDADAVLIATGYSNSPLIKQGFEMLGIDAEVLARAAESEAPLET